MRNPAKARPHPQLWDSCWNALQSLRPAFSRGATFMWFATVVVGMMVRADLLGVTSIIRGLNLRPKLYDPLRRQFSKRMIEGDFGNAGGSKAVRFSWLVGPCCSSRRRRRLRIAFWLPSAWPEWGRG
jgi:hypothetical protein